MEIQVINGTVQVGSRVAFPRNGRFATGTVRKIVQESSEYRDGTIRTRVYVSVDEDRYAWHPSIIRNVNTLVAL